MLGGLLLPRFSEAIAGSGAHVGRLLAQGMQLSFVVMLALLLVGGTQAEAGVAVVAGAAFSDAAPMLRILLIAMGCMYVGMIFGFALVALEQQRYLLKLYAVLAVGNVLANAVLIPWLGGIGAALSTVATEAVAMLLAGRRLHALLTPQWPWLRMAQALVAAGASYVVVVATSRGNVWVDAILLVVVYAIVVGFFGLVSREQLALLRRASTRSVV